MRDVWVKMCTLPPPPPACGLQSPPHGGGNRHQKAEEILGAEANFALELLQF